MQKSPNKKKLSEHAGLTIGVRGDELEYRFRICGCRHFLINVDKVALIAVHNECPAGSGNTTCKLKHIPVHLFFKSTTFSCGNAEYLGDLAIGIG